MRTEICFCLALGVMAAALVLAGAAHSSPYRSGRLMTPIRWVLAGVFLSAALLFLPIHLEQTGGAVTGWVSGLLLSVHSTMRLFVLDGEFDGMLAFAAGQPAPWVGTGYILLGTAIFVLAPALTFGFVLSFFKNVSAYRALLFHCGRDVYAFSELNEKSLALAASVKARRPRSLMVFTDVFENNEETSFELGERARALGAVCFKKDIAEVNWGLRGGSREVWLFAMGEDEAENITQAVRLAERYRDRANYRLFLFASGAESEVLFQSAGEGGMRIRRVNPIRSLISQTLYQQGNLLFENAADADGERLISVVLLGLGGYGTEMLKALSWFCQMDGYQVEIHAFDRDPQAEARFTMQCPELMSPEKNGTRVEGEARYRIAIHSGVDVETAVYAGLLQGLPHVSHVFVALGEDGANIKAAIQARVLCLRSGQCPCIQAVVYDSLKKSALESITDYRGHRYDISFVGDLRSCYSEEVIIDSKLEQAALERHLKWGVEREFWAYEFNYRSSVASAIHMKMRILCGIPGADKRTEELTEEERDGIERLEHRRWNAYMRSEGYIFSGSTDRASRNDLAKLHHDLVPFRQLSEEEKRKDSSVGAR